MRFLQSAAICVLAGQGASAAVTADLSNAAGIKAAAKQVAKDLMAYYTGNKPGDVAGNLPAPYYWWEAGAMFGTMVNYWHYTGDTTYNDITTEAILHQTGDEWDFMPENQTKTLGNDDQGFWGLTAMTAAEVNFPELKKPAPGWLALAQGVFNTQAERWDMQNCGGGLRWQIFPFNNGFSYKNTISNGCFFNIGARLALYTGNATYASWAEKTWDWVHNEGLIDEKWNVFDGTNIGDNCTAKDHNQWTYNAGIYLLGAAAMYNQTNGTAQGKWEERVNGLLNQTINTFFVDGVMKELCEGGQCNVDQRSFKAYLSRWLAATTRIAPFTAATITPLLAKSAAAALKTCTAGGGNTQCGLKWTTGSNDGSFGVGEQMAVLEITQSNLVAETPDWVSAVKGTGNSTGNVDAGSNSVTADSIINKPITTKDRVGAAFFTALILIGVVGGSATMMISE